MLRVSILIGLSALSVGSASAAANLVVNGNFELLTNGLGELGYNTDAVGWTSTGVNYVFGGSSSDSLGATGEFKKFIFWGPANGIPNNLGPSPTGGNFIGAEGAFRVGPISQVISGLVPGRDYTVRFSWAGAQQRGVNGATTENWTVSFGDTSQTTQTLGTASHGFTGWQAEMFTFTAVHSSELLSFLARGTPKGAPPISLLDGVSVEASIPEPATWAMLIAGFALIGVRLRRHRTGYAGPRWTG